jgi:S-adenosylmethionine:tRNA ribosyltransferase-isomerase
MTLFLDYDLPEHLIAQTPAEPRDSSRLMVLRRESGTIEHHIFRDLPNLLAPNDLLVMNDTRVIPARVIGTREQTGGKWEGLFLRELESGEWEMLAKTRGYPTTGEFFLTPSGLRLRLEGRTLERHWMMRPMDPGSAAALLAVHGLVPLPPYIRKGVAGEPDRERYQTVFADRAGSVAAPTAGLHFTKHLLETLLSRSIHTTRVTLHVGIGTFAPMKTEDVSNHSIHSEWCEVQERTVQAIQETKQRRGKVIAVGTTSTRTLESAARSGTLAPYQGDTGLFIRPPFQFHVLDGLLTNFHLPQTSLLLLVQAFSGTELLRRAYAEAIAQGYRFYSYGDAMLIL